MPWKGITTIYQECDVPRSVDRAFIEGCHRWSSRPSYRLISHTDDLWPMQYVIWMKHHATACHPDEFAGADIPYGWLMANVVCHLDETPCHHMSPGWVGWGWYLIRMTYCQRSMSSGWHTMPPYVFWMSWLGLISHRDELRHFYYAIRMTYAPTLP